MVKNKPSSTYQDRINQIKSILSNIKTEKLIEHQPELQYVNEILRLVAFQIVDAEGDLLRTCTFWGKVKRFLRCRDELDCRLNGMVTRMDDLYRRLREGLEEREKGEEGAERWPTKTEGKSVWRSSTILEEDGDREKFEDAVERQEETS